jgi:LysM repeat protein
MKKRQLLNWGNKVLLFAVLFSLLIGCSPSYGSEPAQTEEGSASPTSKRTALSLDRPPQPTTTSPAATPTRVSVSPTVVAVSDSAAGGTFELCVVRPPEDWIAYVVLNGDQFSNIARLSGATVEEIKRVNCRNGDSVAAGELLFLPGASANQPETLPASPPQMDGPAQNDAQQAAVSSGVQQSPVTPEPQPASSTDPPVPPPLPEITEPEEEVATRETEPAIGMEGQDPEELPPPPPPPPPPPLPIPLPPPPPPIVHPPVEPPAQMAPPEIVPPQLAPPQITLPEIAPPQQAPPQITLPEIVPPQIAPPQTGPEIGLPRPALPRDRRRK